MWLMIKNTDCFDIEISCLNASVDYINLISHLMSADRLISCG